MLVVAMQPRDLIALSGVAASVIIAIAGFVYSSVMQQRKQQHDDVLHKDQLDREDKLRGIYRQDVPHIEFAIDCRVHGQQGADLLVEFILTAHNRGLVQWKFSGHSGTGLGGELRVMIARYEQLGRSPAA